MCASGGSVAESRFNSWEVWIIDNMHFTMCYWNRTYYTYYHPFKIVITTLQYIDCICVLCVCGFRLLCAFNSSPTQTVVFILITIESTQHIIYVWNTNPNKWNCTSDASIFHTALKMSQEAVVSSCALLLLNRLYIFHFIIVLYCLLGPHTYTFTLL